MAELDKLLCVRRIRRWGRVVADSWAQEQGCCYTENMCYRVKSPTLACLPPETHARVPLFRVAAGCCLLLKFS